MLGSNNYLGLTNHPEVKDAAALALALLVSADVVVRSFLKQTNRLLAGCVAGFWLGSAAITAAAIAFGIV